MIKCFYCKDFIDINYDEHLYELILRKHTKQALRYSLMNEQKMYICEKCYKKFIEMSENEYY